MCDALLQIEIDEMKSMSKQPGRTDVIEDFTELDDDDDDDEEEEEDDWGVDVQMKLSQSISGSCRSPFCPKN